MEIFQSNCALVPELKVSELARGEVHRLALELVYDALGRSIRIPVMVVRGKSEGPVFGITAVMHGNELNGIPTIHRLFSRLDPQTISGTVVGVPVINVPAYLARARTMREGMDLNRVMPGDEKGNSGEIYAYRLMERLVSRFDYLLDLHTASFGRENALYVRADLDNDVTQKMAHLQDPDIIVHNEAKDGTLRGAAMDQGIPSITVEIGSPHRFERKLVRDSILGIESVLVEFNVLPEQPRTPGLATDVDASNNPVVCRRSSWLYTQHGGLLEVIPKVTDVVEQDEVIARVRNVFGDVLAQYKSPAKAIVIGKSVHPVAESGSRIAHLGFLDS